MPILQVIVLAVVQGLTEFLPVSSTAHLYLTSWLLGWQTEALSFDVMLHLGTLLAILLYFFADWVQLIGQAFGLRVGNDGELKQNPMLLWLMAIATIPVGICGFLFNKQAEGSWRTPWVMGAMLIAVGVLMWVAENAGRKLRDLGSVSLPDALVIGLSQALASGAGHFTQRHHHFRGLVPRPGPEARRPLFVPAFHTRHYRRRRPRRSGTCTRRTCSTTMLTTGFVVGVGVSAITGVHCDRLVSALFAARRLPSVRILPYYFWHNSACSGFHPPASVMKLLSPTQHTDGSTNARVLAPLRGARFAVKPRVLSRARPSWNTASAARPLNLMGYPGSHFADLLLQAFGAASFLFPLLVFALAWRWIRSESVEAGGIKIAGAVLLTFSVCSALSFATAGADFRRRRFRWAARSGCWYPTIFWTR